MGIGPDTLFRHAARSRAATAALLHELNPRAVLSFSAVLRQVAFGLPRLEFKIALVKILMKYKFEQSPETQVPLALHTGDMRSPNNGVFLRVEAALDIFKW